MRLRQTPIAAALAVLALRAAQAAAPLSGLAVSPDGSLVVVGSTAGLAIHSAAELTARGRMATDLEHVAALSFSPDGKYLAAAGGAPAESGAVEIFTWPQRELFRRWDFAVDLVYAVDWSTDSRSLALASFDGTAWQLSIQPSDEAADRQWHPGHSRGLTAVCLLPVRAGADNPPLAVTAGVDQTLRVIDLQSGAPVRTLHNHTAPVHALALQPAAQDALPVVASMSDDRTVRFWQPTIGRMMRFARLDSVPLCHAWSHDGERLVVGCTDGKLRAIDPQTAAVTHVHPVADSPLVSLATLPGKSAVLVGTHAGALRRIENWIE